MEWYMQIQLLVERGQDEHIVNLAGTAYKFRRNEHGHLVSEITEPKTIDWVTDPHRVSFVPYVMPRPKTIIDEVVEESAMPVHEQVGSDVHAPTVVQVDASGDLDFPTYPKKGSKKPPKREG
jgi:hypothetical protein